MNVWLIQISEVLPVDASERKLRTSMLADALAVRGHNITWWTSAFNHLKKEWSFNKDTEIKVSRNLTIKALHGIGYKSNLSLARFVDHRLLSWKFKSISMHQKKPDLIVCSTPSYDLAWRAMKYAARNGIPLIIDVRDQWPDNFIDFVPANFKRALRFLLGHEIRMLKEALKGATAIVSMSTEMLEWSLTKADRPKSKFDRVFYLGFENKNSFSSKQASKTRFSEIKDDDYFVVTFIGTFGKYHDPRIMIESAKITHGLKILYVLGGDGELNNDLRESAKHLDNVLFVGWLNNAEAVELLELSDIGVCSTGKLLNSHFFPNKVFSYWAAGLPVASAFKGELYETIERFNVGFNYANTNQFVRGIRRLFFNRIEHSEISKNAKKLFQENYDAQKIYGEFASHLERIAFDYIKKTN